MGRPAGVEADEIVEAGRHLEAQSKPVNGWSLRAVLGRGRPDRLEAIWREHLSSGAAPDIEVKPEPDVALPPHIHEHNRETKDRLIASIDGLYVQVYRLIDSQLRSQYKADFDRLASERSEMEAKLKVADQVLADVDADRGALADQVETLRREAAAEVVAKARLDEQLVAVRREAAVAAEAAARNANEAATALAAAAAERDELAATAQRQHELAVAAEAARAAKIEELERARADHVVVVERMRAEMSAAQAEAERRVAAAEAATTTVRAEAAEAARAAVAEIERSRAERDGAIERERAAAERFAAEIARMAAAMAQTPSKAKPRTKQKESEQNPE